MTNDNYKAWTNTAFCIFRLRGGSTMRIGMDIGSTTIKCVVLDENDQIIYSAYERHYSHILEKTRELLTS